MTTLFIENCLPTNGQSGKDFTSFPLCRKSLQPFKLLLCNFSSGSLFNDCFGYVARYFGIVARLHRERGATLR